MVNKNEVEKKTYDYDEIEELCYELSMMLGINAKLEVFDILQDLKKRSVYLPCDIEQKKEIELVLNCWLTFRRSVYRFKSLYEN